MQPKLSVIIPVYNVQATLERCVASVTAQTWRDLEIILVDDGATDGSPALCDRLAAADARVTVLNRANAGLGAARNAGLAQAAGTFVAFVDADDYLAPDAYARVLAALVQTKAPVAYFGHYDVIGAAAPTPNGQPPRQTLLTGAALAAFHLDVIAPDCRSAAPVFTGVAAWGAVYSRDFLATHGITFFSERDIISEDILFNFQVTGAAARVAVVPAWLYYYVQHSGTLSTSHRADRWEKSKAMVATLRRLGATEAAGSAAGNVAAQPVVGRQPSGAGDAGAATATDAATAATATTAAGAAATDVTTATTANAATATPALPAAATPCIVTPELDRRLARLLLISLLVCLKQECQRTAQVGRRAVHRTVKALVADPATRAAVRAYPLGRLPRLQTILFALVRIGWTGAVLLLVRLKLKGETPC
ncbi:glycosyltransferase [Lacticaseibacillus suihuaensis]